MSRVVWFIYVQPLHKIILFSILLIVAWACVGSRADRKLWWRFFNAAVFLCVVAVILYVTLYSRKESVRDVILIPFHSFIEAKEQPELYRSMLMNVFLFVPLGLSFPYILPDRWGVAAHMVFAVLAGGCLSAVVEAVQYRYGLGRCEVDDVIMNTLGALLGAQAYMTGNRFAH